MEDLPKQRCVVLTPPGRGAVAAVLVEGTGARDAVQSVFLAAGGRPLGAFTPDRLIYGRLGDPPGEEVILRCRSAESVEVHCHGGTAAVGRLEGLFVRAGFSAVDWHAWIAVGEADPFAAEARRALAEARTVRTAAILLDQYHGALKREFKKIEMALGMRGAGRGARGARSEARDWGLGIGDWTRSETPVSERENSAFRTPHSALETSSSLRQRLEALQALIPLGRHLTSPWRVVLAGRPNVGKSSLLNALVGYGRVIVHEQPGTTRDAVTAQTALDGWPVELCDTAGLGAGASPLEQTGAEWAEQKMREADLSILITDAGRPWSEEDQSLAESWPQSLLVHNKCDLPSSPVARPTGLSVSALSGQGMDVLAKTIAQRLVPHPPPAGAAVPFTEAHVQQIENWANEIGKEV